MPPSPVARHYLAPTGDSTCMAWWLVAGACSQFQPDQVWRRFLSLRLDVRG